MRPRRSLRRERLPLPLGEGVGGRGPVPHDPSPRPPPSRGGGACFLLGAFRGFGIDFDQTHSSEVPPALEGLGRKAGQGWGAGSVGAYLRPTPPPNPLPSRGG